MPCSPLRVHTVLHLQEGIPKITREIRTVRLSPAMRPERCSLSRHICSPGAQLQFLLPRCGPAGKKDIIQRILQALAYGSRGFKTILPGSHARNLRIRNHGSSMPTKAWVSHTISWVHGCCVLLISWRRQQIAVSARSNSSALLHAKALSKRIRCCCRVLVAVMLWCIAKTAGTHAA